MSDFSSPRVMFGTFLFILAGPIFWALQYTSMYGAQSALCAFDFGETAGGANPAAAWTVVGVSVLAIVATTLVFVFPGWVYRAVTGGAAGEQFVFLTAVMRILAGLSILAMVFAAIAPAFMPACGQLR